MRLLLISGSLRAGSGNTALLRTVQTLMAGEAEAVLSGEQNELPHFNPDDDHEPQHPAVSRLRASIGQSDALLFSTPEYAGALPGSFKNLLDWTVGGGEMDRKPVAWINASGPAAPSGAADAHASLRKVLGYTGSVIVESACVRIPVQRQDIGADGLVADAGIREQLKAVLEDLAGQVRALRAGELL